MSCISNGVKIIVENTKQEYHSIRDWGLAVGNNNCIGTPVQELNYVTVPGASRNLDLSEVLTGKPVFKYRPIDIVFGGMRRRTAWDTIISQFRNCIEGRVVHIIFDNDPSYYWRGRVEIGDYDRARELGKFTLKIPMADPYKYEVQTSAEPWKWDPFNFYMGAIRYIGRITINNSAVLIPRGNMETVPIFEIETITSSALTVTANGKTYTLNAGKNRFPGLKIAGQEEVLLQFSGEGIGTIEYRGGSL